MSVATPPDLPNVWLPDIAVRIAQYLDDNEVVCCLKFVDKAAASLFEDRVVVKLSQPVPNWAFRYKWDQPGSVRHLNFQKRRKFVYLTAASGCLANLEVALKQAGHDATTGRAFDGRWSDPMRAAAIAGHIHVCEWLHQYGCRLYPSHVYAAALAGQQGSCAWLLDHGVPWEREAMYAAGRGGHLGLMEWLLACRPAGAAEPSPMELLISVTEGCDLATMKRYLTQYWEAQGRQPGLAMLRRRVVSAAASSTSPDWQAKVLFLEQQGYLEPSEDYYPVGGFPCISASRCPDAAERVPWLMARGYAVDEGPVQVAAGNGDVELLRILLAEGAGIPPEPEGIAVQEAVTEGQLEAVKLMNAHGWVDSSINFFGPALSGGHLPVAAWLLAEGGCTLEQLHKAAARKGSRWIESCDVEMLEWLHARGCSVVQQADLMSSNATLNVAAVVKCSEEVIEWLLAHGYKFPVDCCVYSDPISSGDLGMLRSLHRLGCPWKAAEGQASSQNWSPGVRACLEKLGLA